MPKTPEQQASNEKWMQNNPNYMKEYYQRKRDEKLLKAKQYREANPEKVKAGLKKWYEKNKAKVIAKAQEWDKNHPDNAKKRVQARLARKQNAISNLSDDDVRRILEKGCLFCGAKEDLTLAHDTPLSKGGNTTKGNIFCLCRSCNSQMSTKQLKDLLKQKNLF